MIDSKVFTTHFIPAKIKSKKLMLVLHGKGDSLRPFMEFDRELNIPQMNYLLLNAPKKFMRGFSWYGEPPFQAHGVSQVRTMLFTLLQELAQQGWSSKDIFWLGFSQGCLVSADVALHYSKAFAGLIGVSGYFHFQPRWRQQIARSAIHTPWLLTHGKNDEVLPIEDTKYGLRKLQSLGLQLDWVESNKKHEFDRGDLNTIRSWLKCRLDNPE